MTKMLIWDVFFTCPPRLPVRRAPAPSRTHPPSLASFVALKLLSLARFTVLLLSSARQPNKTKDRQVRLPTYPRLPRGRREGIEGMVKALSACPSDATASPIPPRPPRADRHETTLGCRVVWTSRGGTLAGWLALAAPPLLARLAASLQ